MRWLSDNACQLPCWEGITPGKTTSREAVQRLQQLPFVRNVADVQAGPAIRVVRWSWVGETAETGLAYYTATTPEPPQPLLSLGITLSQPLPIKDIISIYGESSHIQAGYLSEATMTAKPGYTLTFFYQSRNFQAIWLSDGPEMPVLNENIPIQLITIIDPHRDSVTLMGEQYLANAGITPWRGFRDFVDYCVDMIYGGPCK